MLMFILIVACNNPEEIAQSPDLPAIVEGIWEHFSGCNNFIMEIELYLSCELVALCSQMQWIDLDRTRQALQVAGELMPNFDPVEKVTGLKGIMDLALSAAIALNVNLIELLPGFPDMWSRFLSAGGVVSGADVALHVTFFRNVGDSGTAALAMLEHWMEFPPHKEYDEDLKKHCEKIYFPLYVQIRDQLGIPDRTFGSAEAENSDVTQE
jgi:hypothetical protein